MKININSQVSVKLTDSGETVIISYWDSLGVVAAHYSLQESKIVTMPFWELMQIFGPSVHMGMPKMLFVDNEVEIIE